MKTVTKIVPSAARTGFVPLLRSRHCHAGLSHTAATRLMLASPTERVRDRVSQQAPGRPSGFDYICTSLMCVAMYHLFPKESFTAAVRSP